MSLTERRFFSGDTLEQALMRAARHHQIEPDELDYQLVEKRHGFVRIRRSVVIEVDPRNPRREPRPVVEVAPPARPPRLEPPPPPAERAPAPPRRDRRPEREAREDEEAFKPSRPARPLRERLPVASGALALAAEKALRLALDFARLELDLAVLEGEEELVIELWGPDEAALLREEGELLLALQYLLPKLIRGFIGEVVLCRLDCRDFHHQREERLRRLALRTAQRVREEGRAETLDPMPPDERRIVHLTLADEPGVTTASRGTGLYKRVVIEPERHV